MQPILIVYATREGHTKRVAEYVAERVRSYGIQTNVFDARKPPATLSLSAYSAVVVAGSVHVGKHEPELSKFVMRHRRALNQMVTAFLSVSLVQAGAQDEHAPQEKRDKAAADVTRLEESFFAETKWRPVLIQAIAGALTYTKYNFLIRFIMKRIARKEGASTDTSRDHVFTRWADLDAFASQLVAAVAGERVAAEVNVSGEKQT